MNRKHKTAFTLIELLTVIVIIGILAGLTLPALNKARQRAQIAKCVATIASLQTALGMYEVDYGMYPPTATGTAEADQYNGNSSHSSAPYNLVNALTSTDLGGPYMGFKGKDLDESTSNLPVLLDPWAQAYIYVARKYEPGSDAHTSRGPFHPHNDDADDRKNNTYNIYSLGPDKKTYGNEAHDDTSTWNDSELFDNPEDGDWDSATVSTDPHYDDINSWDGTRSGE